MSKNKKPIFGKKRIIYLILGSLALKRLSFLFKKKQPELSHNFRKFLHKEKNEMIELASGKESFGKYCHDSSSLFVDYFIPHKCNNHKPKILRTKSLVVIAVMLVILKVSLGAYLFLVYPNQAQMSEEIINKVLILINRDRKVQGLNELNFNPSLNKYALDKANDLIAKNYFAHYSPDGRKPWDFIDRTQYKYLFVGENLAMNFTNADSVHKALMNSESHKKNILNKRYDDIGLAMATGEINGKTTNVLVEFFATRNSPTLAAKANEFKTVAIAKADTKTVMKPVIESKPKIIPVENEKSAEEIKKEELALNESMLANTSVAKSLSQSVPAITKNLDTKVASIESTESVLSEAVKAGQAKLERKYLVKPEVNTIKSKPEIVMDYNKYDPILFKANTSPNIDIDNFKMIEIKSFSNIDETFALTAEIVKITRYIFMTILALVCLTLIVNIVVKLEVQHHSVIIQTMFLLILISGLLYMRTNFLESVATSLLVI